MYNGHFSFRAKLHDVDHVDKKLIQVLLNVKKNSSGALPLARPNWQK
jgi:hypothetical protein